MQFYQSEAHCLLMLLPQQKPIESCYRALLYGCGRLFSGESIHLHRVYAIHAITMSDLTSFIIIQSPTVYDIVSYFL